MFFALIKFNIKKKDLESKIKNKNFGKKTDFFKQIPQRTIFFLFIPKKVSSYSASII